MRIEHWSTRLHIYDYNNFVERTEGKNSSNKRNSTLCLHGQVSVRSLQHNSCVVSRIKVWMLTKTRWNESYCLNEQLGASDNREDSHRTRRRNKLRISTTGTLLIYKFCNFCTVWQILLHRIPCTWYKFSVTRQQCVFTSPRLHKCRLSCKNSSDTW